MKGVAPRRVVSGVSNPTNKSKTSNGLNVRGFLQHYQKGRRTKQEVREEILDILKRCGTYDDKQIVYQQFLRFCSDKTDLEFNAIHQHMNESGGPVQWFSAGITSSVMSSLGGAVDRSQQQYYVNQSTKELFVVTAPAVPLEPNTTLGKITVVNEPKTYVGIELVFRENSNIQELCKMDLSLREDIWNIFVKFLTQNKVAVEALSNDNLSTFIHDFIDDINRSALPIQPISIVETHIAAAPVDKSFLTLSTQELAATTKPTHTSTPDQSFKLDPMAKPYIPYRMQPPQQTLTRRLFENSYVCYAPMTTEGISNPSTLQYHRRTTSNGLNVRGFLQHYQKGRRTKQEVREEILDILKRCGTYDDKQIIYQQFLRFCSDKTDPEFNAIHQHMNTDHGV